MSKNIGNNIDLWHLCLAIHHAPGGLFGIGICHCCEEIVLGGWGLRIDAKRYNKICLNKSLECYALISYNVLHSHVQKDFFRRDIQALSYSLWYSSNWKKHPFARTLCSLSRKYWNITTSFSIHTILCLSVLSSKYQNNGQIFTQPSSTTVQNPNYLWDPTSGPHITLFRYDLHLAVHLSSQRTTGLEWLFRGHLIHPCALRITVYSTAFSYHPNSTVCILNSSVWSLEQPFFIFTSIYFSDVSIFLRNIQFTFSRVCKSLIPDSPTYVRRDNTRCPETLHRPEPPHAPALQDLNI